MNSRLVPNAEGKELVMTRTFNAPRALTFEAWTDPQRVAQWWGPSGYTTPVCELDVRPGGAILIHMQAPDGTVFPTKGVYVEVVPPERIVYTALAFENAQGTPALEVRHTITFVERDGKTEITLHAVVTKVMPEAADAVTGMQQGWEETFDRLATHMLTMAR